MLKWLIVLGGFALYLVLGRVWVVWDTRKKNAERSHRSIETFVKEFDDTDYDPAVIRAVYEDITDETSYPILRRDPLKTLGFTDEDVDTLIEERVGKWNATHLYVPDNDWDAEIKAVLPLSDVDSYVRLLSEIRKRIAADRPVPYPARYRKPFQ